MTVRSYCWKLLLSSSSSPPPLEKIDQYFPSSRKVDSVLDVFVVLFVNANAAIIAASPMASNNAPSVDAKQQQGEHLPHPRFRRRAFLVRTCFSTFLVDGLSLGFTVSLDFLFFTYSFGRGRRSTLSSFANFRSDVVQLF